MLLMLILREKIIDEFNISLSLILLLLNRRKEKKQLIYLITHFITTSKASQYWIFARLVTLPQIL